MGIKESPFWNFNSRIDKIWKNWTLSKNIDPTYENVARKIQRWKINSIRIAIVSSFPFEVQVWTSYQILQNSMKMSDFIWLKFLNEKNSVDEIVSFAKKLHYYSKAKSICILYIYMSLINIDLTTVVKLYQKWNICLYWTIWITVYTSHLLSIGSPKKKFILIKRTYI